MMNSKEAMREQLLAARTDDEVHVAATEPPKAVYSPIKAAYDVAPKAAAAPPLPHLTAPDDTCCAAGFSSGLCECCTGPQACQICMMSWLLPCFAHGILADHASDGASGQQTPCMLYTFGWTGLAWLMKTPMVATGVLGMLTRGNLRKKYGLASDGVGDCCTHMWCHPCAMAQEIRHIRDVRAAAIAPPAPGGTLDAAPKAEKMALIDWQPVESKDKVASLTKAYL